MSLYTNQFKQTNEVGVLDLTTNPNPFVMTVLYNPGGAGGDIVPGEGLILKDLGASDYSGNIPVVDVRALDADAIEGVFIYDNKRATAEVGARITIAKVGAIIVMKASAAIVRGAKVALVLLSPGEVVTATTEAVFGKALDKAAAADDLIRVEVLANGVV